MPDNPKTPGERTETKDVVEAQMEKEGGANPLPANPASQAEKKPKASQREVVPNQETG